MTEPRSLRVAFLGSPPFATPILARLVGSPHRPVVVVTPPDRAAGRGRKPRPSPVAELAEAHGIELLRPGSAKDPELRARLAELELDVLLVASYGEILDDAFLALARVAPLNVHGSLLPRWRGASPVQAAILAGDGETGVSVQRVVRKLDAGDVLLERRTPIGERETAGELFERLAALGADAAVEALDALAAGTATFTPQDETRVTVCRKLAKDAGELDWSQTAVELERRVRATTPWPGARTTLPDGRRLTVRAAEVRDDAERHDAVRGGAARDGAGEPGALLAAGDELLVATGEGALALLEVQAEGKRALPAADFLRGTPLAVGERLGGG